MTPSDALRTLQLAQRHGGSFAAALAHAGLLADPGNRARLLSAFPELERAYGPTSPFWAAALEVCCG